MLVEDFVNRSISGLFAFASPGSRVFWLYLVSAFVLAVLSFYYFRDFSKGEKPEKIQGGLFGYIFDRSVFLHRSALQDYVYFIVNAILYGGIISQALLFLHAFQGLFVEGFEAVLGARTTGLFEPSMTAALLWTVASVLVIDFALFLAHYLQHRYPVLWQFHQVHHSAEVLTPMTFFRMHPVDLIGNTLLSVLFGGLAMAGYIYFSNHHPQQLMIGTVNVVFFAFYIFGYNLRHSHIWLSYPRWLSYVLISPAQHQTHHSVDVKHFDRNFGLIFSVWDWMFGTLYVPKGYERLTFGLSRERPNPFPTVGALYLHPFRNAWAIIRRKSKAMPVRVGGAVAVLLLAGALAAGQSGVRAGGYVPPGVHLEDLTWTEVARAIEAGYDGVIVPTGGTEQNGPHVVLGKHNRIVRHTAGTIAERLGNTLVAPVLTYVPEGDPGDAPSGHMRWPGTLTLPEPVFEAVLEAAVRSYATHGFTRIYLLGDSAGNQAAQARVAERLTADGLTVLHVADYYSGNGQVEWLKARGFSEDQIGQHAGIRDTSELMAVDRAGVRAEPLPAPERPDLSFSGAIGEASAEIGEAMLELKIEAALRQMRGAGGS